MKHALQLANTVDVGQYAEPVKSKHTRFLCAYSAHVTLHSTNLIHANLSLVCPFSLSVGYPPRLLLPSHCNSRLYHASPLKALEPVSR